MLTHLETHFEFYIVILQTFCCILLSFVIFLFLFYLMIPKRKIGLKIQILYSVLLLFPIFIPCKTRERSVSVHKVLFINKKINLQMYQIPKINNKYVFKIKHYVITSLINLHTRTNGSKRQPLL